VTFSILDTIAKGGTFKADMHELSLAKNIFDIALKHAEAKKILQVNLLIGQLSDEREESIQFYWDDLAKGTRAQGANLHFQYVDAEMKCLECGTVFHPKEEIIVCPSCQSQRLKLISGDDVKIDSIDVE
jgi:hydrogenase nickel incorporation protein HypA/HybF